MSETEKPIVIAITKAGQGWPVGAEVGVSSVAVAKAVYPGSRVIRYQDGSAYVPPEPVKPAKTEPVKKDR